MGMGWNSTISFRARKIFSLLWALQKGDCFSSSLVRNVISGRQDSYENVSLLPLGCVDGAEDWLVENKILASF